MQLSNLKAHQDDVLTACEKFGGEAAKAAEIAEYLDGLVGDRDDTIKELKRELSEVRRDKLSVEVEFESAQEQIQELRDEVNALNGEIALKGGREP